MTGHSKWEDIKHKRDRYQVLGLAGQQGSGKDWTYDVLVALYQGKRRVMRMGFADGVRREVTVEVMGAIPGVTIGDTAGAGTWSKPYTAGQRWILQQWGTEYRRAQDPDYWLKYGMGWLEQNAEPGDLWCITDVRFSNEMEAIEALPYGTTALVNAPVDVRALRLGLTETELRSRSNHASEVIDFDPTHAIANYADVTLAPALLGWLGLEPSCMQCQFATAHAVHDSGVVFA